MFHVHSEQYLVIYVMCIQIRAVSLLEFIRPMLHMHSDQYLIIYFICIQSSAVSLFDYKLTPISGLILVTLKAICLPMNKSCDYMIISANLRNQ